MRCEITKCDKCGKEIEKGSDVYILRLKSKGKEPDAAGGSSEHNYIQHELCPPCARHLPAILDFVVGLVR